MKKLVFVLSILFVGVASCDSGQTITPEGTATEPENELSFEETVRSHTEKYCTCSKDLNEFVAKTDAQTLDSADIAEYQLLQSSFMQCFDPTGEISAFGNALDSAKRVRQKQLFNQYRQEICPDIIPKD